MDKPSSEAFASKGGIMADTLVLVRGLPGSGKTSFALHCIEGRSDYVYVSADQYFTNDHGIYKFDPLKLPDAHSWCARRVRAHIENPHLSTVYLANTFSMRWEMQPYFNIAQSYEQGRIRVYVVDLYDGGMTDGQLALRNQHDVPKKTIENMRARWEHDWSDANPRKPAKYWADARKRRKRDARNRKT